MAADDNALVPIKTDYAVLKADKDKMREVLEGARGLTALNLPRIRVPSSGQKFWTVPTLDGDKPEDKFRGIILLHRDGRLFWQRGMDEGGGGAPPDCVSNDAEVGYGCRFEGDEPGLHLCDGDPLKRIPPCPFSQFGSGKSGRGQKCKAVKVLFILRTSEFLPTVLALPPTSLKNIKELIVRVISQGKSLYEYEAEWSLEVTENPEKIKYSKAVPKIVRELSPEEKRQVKILAAQYKLIFSQVKVQEEVQQE